MNVQEILEYLNVASTTHLPDDTKGFELAIWALRDTLLEQPEPVEPEEIGTFWLAREKGGKAENPFTEGEELSTNYILCSHELTCEHGLYPVPCYIEGWPPRGACYEDMWFMYTDKNWNLLFQILHPNLTLDPGQQRRVRIM